MTATATPAGAAPGMNVQQLMDLAPYITAVVTVLGTAFFWYTTQRGGIILTRKKCTLKISEIELLSSDTKRIRLAFPRTGMTLGLPVGKHFKIFSPNPNYKKQSTWNGREDEEASRAEIERAYTPVTGNEVTGYVDLVIKMYRPGKITMPDGREMNWADGGKMTGGYLDSKRVGDAIEINGPYGLVEYVGGGRFKLPGRGKEPSKFSHVGLMAGGSGITPILQILLATIRDQASDQTQFSVIYANKTEADILCKDLLLSLEAQSKGRIKIDFTLDFPPEGWTYSKGFITQDMIKKDLPSVNKKPLVLMCGPPPMVEFACKKNLFAIDYPKEDCIAF